MSSPSQIQISVPIPVVPVREDHLAAIVRFISFQRTVVKAAVPRHLYGMQAEAHRQLIELMPILDTYRYSEDTTTITVDLGKSAQQKMLVSPKALTQDTNVLNEANPIGHKKSDQLEDDKAVITEALVADTVTQPQNKPNAKELESQPARIKVKVKATSSTTAFPTAFPRAPMPHRQTNSIPMHPGSTKPVIKPNTVAMDKIKQKCVPETTIPSNSIATKRKQTSCSIDHQPAKRAKTNARIPAISLNGSATQGQINQKVRKGWNTRKQGRQDQREALAWQKPEHRFGSMVIKHQ